jgi:hypothetical protein
MAQVADAADAAGGTGRIEHMIKPTSMKTGEGVA